jgi:ATP phosphoribosyltransferase
MRAAGLKAIETVMETQAVLISSLNSGSRSPTMTGKGDLRTLITNRIRGVIAAKRYALLNYNVPRSMLPEVVKITPGKRAPTVSGLESQEGEAWVAVSVMVERKNVAQVMDELENAGASDILVFNIINSRFALIFHNTLLTLTEHNQVVRPRLWSMISGNAGIKRIPIMKVIL